MVKKESITQPEVNIGLVGHVDHGKTTLTQQLTGQWTDTHSEELKRGITIRLGYANTAIYKIKGKKGAEALTTKKEKNELVRAISLVDAPGHESLMATMLAGATIMDGALLLVSATEKCPQPQTKEHIMALEIMGIKNVIIVQNKIDLVSQEKAEENYNQIQEFLKGTSYEEAPIIPVSAQKGVNIDLLLETIEKVIPTPKRDSKLDPIMFVARSFDINKPGSTIDKIEGGVIGGSLSQGVLKVGQRIEMRPGRGVEEKNKKVWKPVFAKILALKYGGNDVKEVIPGGTFGVLTSLDPAMVKSDYLAGNLAGLPDKLPPILEKLELEVHLLERVVGVEDDLKVDAIKITEPLMLNVNSSATVGVVTLAKKGKIECKLKLPVCADKGNRVTISRRIGNRFRLIGYGIIK